MKVAIFVMQKNEADLLEPWLTYHEYLFGSDSLFVFDNGSNEPAISEILNRARARGVHVYLQYNDKTDFENKNVHFERLISDWSGKFDFFIPLDADEFLALERNGIVLSDRDAITDELEGLRSVTNPIAIKGAYFNSGVAPDRFFFYNQEKCFFRDGTFKWIDHGFHRGVTQNNGAPVASGFVHVHFHYKPYEILQAHSRAKLAPFLSDFSEQSLRNYQGTGSHVAPYLLWTKEQYHAVFDSHDCKKLPNFAVKMQELGLEYPFFGAEES